MFSFQNNKYLSLNENKESKNLSKARHYLESKGYSQEKANQIINAIRSDIPASRMFEYKFMLGICRLYLTGEITQTNIQQANKTIKLLGSAHIDEYDNDLNGEHLETLIDRFSGVASMELEQSKEESNKKQFTKNENYQIVKIPNFETASKYKDYTSWCITKDPKMYDSYTAGGAGLFYFCLIKDFKNIKEEKGEGCPLDEYGLSMLAISVDVHGDLNTCTCRWNHDNGGSENVLDKNQIEDLLGVNFYETFKPYTKEELKAKGIISPEDVEKMLISNSYIPKFNDIHHYTGFSSNTPVAIIKSIEMDYENKLKTKYALIIISKTKYINLLDLTNNKLLFKKWGITSGENSDNYIDIKINNKCNFVNLNGEFLLKDWVDDIRYIGHYFKLNYNCYEINNIKYFAVCALNNKKNIVAKDGTYLFDEWIDKFEAFAKDINDIYKNNIQNLSKQEQVNADYTSYNSLVETVHKHIIKIMKNGKYKFIDFNDSKSNKNIIISSEWVDKIEIYYDKENKENNRLLGYLNDKCIYKYDILNHSFIKDNQVKEKLQSIKYNILNESIEEIYDSVSPAQINLKSFETKETLNPRLWNENGELDPKIRKRLLTIGMDFYESLNIETLPKDIIVVGSNASYNWSKYSDIDLHILMDFNEIDDNTNLLRKYFDQKKIIWENHHNITIYGYDVELYVQNINEENISDGVYSLTKNEWIQIPHAKDIRLDKKLITHQAAKLINLIDNYLEESKQNLNKNDLEKLYIKSNKLYKLIFQNRRDGLAQFGESATQNIVFKVLRRSGHLKTLRQLKFKIYDKLESL